jgi:hypothetical protein
MSGAASPFVANLPAGGTADTISAVASMKRPQTRWCDPNGNGSGTFTVPLLMA